MHVSTADVKVQEDGNVVGISGKVVTAVFENCLYVSKIDRFSGIKIVPTEIPDGLAVGLTVDVAGTLQTVNGERQIADATVVITGTGSVEPLGVNNNTVGGGDWQYDPVTGAGQRGITGATGTNNIGLLITTWGRDKLMLSGRRRHTAVDKGEEPGGYSGVLIRLGYVIAKALKGR